MSGSVRIKICGIQTPEEAQLAIEAGADLLGLNFVPGSPRCIDVATAQSICEAVADEPVERVAVFRDASWDEIDKVLRVVEFERVQFHGDETEEDLESIDLPTIKAIRGADMEAAEAYPSAILLLDHPHSGGGQGQAWDWSDAEQLIATGQDIIIAGGLNPENVGEALADVGDLPPWGVDVATGVEGADHVKDLDLMKSFVAAVREAEARVEVSGTEEA